MLAPIRSPFRHPCPYRLSDAALRPPENEHSAPSGPINRMRLYRPPHLRFGYRAPLDVTSSPHRGRRLVDRCCRSGSARALRRCDCQMPPLPFPRYQCTSTSSSRWTGPSSGPGLLRQPRLARYGPLSRRVAVLETAGCRCQANDRQSRRPTSLSPLHTTARCGSRPRRDRRPSRRVAAVRGTLFSTVVAALACLRSEDSDDPDVRLLTLNAGP